MKFSKFNQPHRRASACTKNKQSQTEQQRDEQAFAEFEKATGGTFNGFAMVNSFHSHYKMSDALEILTADDCADVVTSMGATIHAGADGVTVYIMTEQARIGNMQKIVRFNRSVYIF